MPEPRMMKIKQVRILLRDDKTGLDTYLTLNENEVLSLTVTKDDTLIEQNMPVPMSYFGDPVPNSYLVSPFELRGLLVELKFLCRNITWVPSVDIASRPPSVQRAPEDPPAPPLRRRKRKLDVTDP